MAQSLRSLTDEEKEKLAKDTNLITEFKQNKFEKEAQKNWDIFYKRNTTKFFKDRHWTRREFGELINSSNEEHLVVFEVGCGVGNFMFPLMAEDENMYFYACDFSHRAVQFVKDNPCYDPSRCTAFQCDIVNDDLTNHVPEGGVDVATMIFVLSAIHPDKMDIALKKIQKILKPGGCLLIRDYGLYDYAMLRFAPGHKLSENFYVRQDGTRAYYFSLEKLDTLMRSSGFDVSRSDYIHRQTVNKKEGLEVPRIFVQGKFVKPSKNSTESPKNGPTRDSCANCDKQKEAVETVISCAGSEKQVSNDIETASECNTLKDKNSACTEQSVVSQTELFCENCVNEISKLTIETDNCLNSVEKAEICDRTKSVTEVNAKDQTNLGAVPDTTLR